MPQKADYSSFATICQKLLAEYGTEVDEIIGREAQAVAKEGVKKLKARSPKKSGDYAKGWHVVNRSTRMTTSFIIANKHSGLPHLLEKGHVKRNGGRVAGKPHIKPVEEETVKDFETKVKEALR